MNLSLRIPDKQKQENSLLESNFIFDNNSPLLNASMKSINNSNSPVDIDEFKKVKELEKFNRNIDNIENKSQIIVEDEDDQNPEELNKIALGIIIDAHQQNLKKLMSKYEITREEDKEIVEAAEEYEAQLQKSKVMLEDLDNLEGNQKKIKLERIKNNVDQATEKMKKEVDF